MSFNATFYKFAKAHKSTARPSGGTSYEILLKDGCDVLNPAIQLKLSAAENPSGFNYCHIPLFDRYYYCRWKWENRLWTAYCEVDELATYKEPIGASTQYVTRSASAYDLNISDTKYPTKAEVVTHSAYLDTIANSINTDIGSYIVGIKSRDSNSGAGFYVLNETAFRGLVYYMFTDVWLDSGDIDKALQKMIVNPFDYIISCNWYPFQIATEFNDNIYFGYWDSGVKGHLLRLNERLKSIGQQFELPQHPQVARGKYLNASPYTQLTLDFYAFGRIPLDPNLFIDNRNGIVTMGIDLFTGMGTLKVESNDGRVLLTSATCSIPVQLSQVRNDLVKPLISAFGTSWSYATGNMIGVAAGIANTIEGAKPQIASIGAVGSISAYAFSRPKIDCYFYNIVDEDIANFGRPLCKVRKINTLSGFIQCENVEVKIAGTAEEIRAITELMESGFYYE